MIAAILFIFYLGLIFRSFRVLPLFRNSGFSTRGLNILFSIKLAFGIALVLVYTYYYTDRGLADVYKYFDDGNAIYKSVGTHPRAFMKVLTGIRYDHSDPEIQAVLAETHHFDKKDGGLLESNARLVIRFNILIRFISYECIYVHTLIFCFLSFIGLMALYRALRTFFEEDSGRILVIPVFLIPSVLFWSSGLLKETLIIFFLGMLLFTAVKLLEGRNILTNLLLSALCLHFLYLSKPFIAIVFLISFYGMATFHFRGYLRLVGILVATGAVLWFMYAHNTFICEISSSLIAKRNEFVRLGQLMKAGSMVDSQMHGGGCLEPLRLAPKGFYNMFMQPYFWSRGLFEKVFGLENLLVLLFSAFCLFFFRFPERMKRQLMIFCLSFFLLNYVLIGITVPIIGALVRYKIFGLIFYLVFLLCWIDFKKLISMSQKSKMITFIESRVKRQLFSTF